MLVGIGYSTSCVNKMSFDVKPTYRCPSTVLLLARLARCTNTGSRLANVSLAAYIDYAMPNKGMYSYAFQIRVCGLNRWLEPLRSSQRL